MSKQLSPIQSHILSKLKNAKSLRYSELHPEKVPNDLFNYHLQQLVKNEFVTRSEDGYFLSDTGLKYVADPYPGNNAITSLFKVNVITIVSRTVNGTIEILNQVRKSNPSYGKTGVMGGVVLKGELIEAAATRKLRQETGLEAELRLVGCERRIMYRSGELFSDVMFPIAYAASSSGELKAETDFGENLWVPIDRAVENESAAYDSIRSITTVLEAVRDGTIDRLPLFFEEEIQSDIVEND